MDREDITPGEKWRISITRAIKHSSFFLACLSVNSVDRRGFLQREIKQALDICQELLDSDIYLIPIRLEDCEIPESLREYQAVDLFKEYGLTRLLDAIKKGIEQQLLSHKVSRKMTEGFETSGVERKIVSKGRRRKILVVDNAPDIRSTLSGAFSDEDFFVWTASNEAEALDAVRQETFDFAIIDVRLHGDDEDDESGLSLALAIRGLNPNIRVIHLTGFIRPNQIVRAIRDYGAADFIEKTPDMDQKILEIIKN
jgi:ActR/RegA family two-component response regulator